jgi:hypothetical protein
MASESLMSIIHNGMNDVMRDAYNNVIKRLDENNLLTEEIKSIITTMIDTVKTNKKIRKSSKKGRLSGYHLYMREHRKIVKEEHPNITPQEMTSVLAKSWKDVPEEKKQDYNERAKKESSDSEDDSVPLVTEETSTNVDDVSKDTAKSTKKKTGKTDKDVNTTDDNKKKVSKKIAKKDAKNEKKESKKNNKKVSNKNDSDKDVPSMSQNTEIDLSDDCIVDEEIIESESDLDI